MGIPKVFCSQSTHDINSLNKRRSIINMLAHSLAAVMAATYLRIQLMLPPFGINFRFSHITAVPVPPQEAVEDFSSKKEVATFAIFQLQDGSSSSFHR